MMTKEEFKKKILFVFYDANLTGSSISLVNILQFSNICTKYDVYIHVPYEHGAILKLLSKLDCTVIKFGEVNLDKRKIQKIKYYIKYYIKLLIMYYKLKPNLIYFNTIMNFNQLLLSKVFFFKNLVHVHEGKLLLNKNTIRLKIMDFFIDRYINVSQYSRNVLISIVGNKKKKIVIPNGIKIPNISISTNQFEFHKKIVNLSVVATIDRNKNQLDAIKALNFLISSKLNKIFILNLFGKTTDQKYFLELQEYINDNNLSDYIRFHGEVVCKNDIYQNTDILLVTSQDESFSIVIIEGFSYFVPVVSTKTGGAKEIINDERNGFFYSSGNYKELANRILYVISFGNKISKILETANRDLQHNFDIFVTSNMVEKMLDECFKGDIK